MGTTQRIVPGITGEPNWGDLNKSITKIAKEVAKENEIEDDSNIDVEELAKLSKKIMDRRNDLIKSAFKSLIKTGGGRRSIVKGKSNSIGKAGLRTSNKLVSFFLDVRTNGFPQALTNINFGNLTGKSTSDIINFLLIHCSDSSTGMDETAASKASCEVLNQLADEANNDLTQFQQLIQNHVDERGLADLVCSFFGYYIFEHLSQRFQEKITQQRGEPLSAETFNVIKEDILGRVKRLNEERPKVNWYGTERDIIIESIFDSIIKILT
jgi:hypothetical protein